MPTKRVRVAWLLCAMLSVGTHWRPGALPRKELALVSIRCTPERRYVAGMPPLSWGYGADGSGRRVWAVAARRTRRSESSRLPSAPLCLQALAFMSTSSRRRHAWAEPSQPGMTAAVPALAVATMALAQVSTVYT